MGLNTNRYDIYKDNFNIYNLITKIDKNYLLVFDKIKKRFSVLNSAKNYQNCLNFYNFSLDIIKSLQFTRVDNSQKLFNFIDCYNENLERKNIDDLKFKTSTAVNDLIAYSKRTNSISKNDINKIIRGSHD